MKLPGVGSHRMSAGIPRSGERSGRLAHVIILGCGAILLSLVCVYWGVLGLWFARVAREPWRFRPPVTTTDVNLIRYEANGGLPPAKRLEVEVRPLLTAGPSGSASGASSSEACIGAIAVVRYTDLEGRQTVRRRDITLAQWEQLIALANDSRVWSLPSSLELGYDVAYRAIELRVTRHLSHDQTVVGPGLVARYDFSSSIATTTISEVSTTGFARMAEALADLASRPAEGS